MLAQSDDLATTATPISGGQPRSRRAVLAAAAGAAAALAAVLARPGETQAAAGDKLTIGSSTNNAGTSNTILTTNSSVVAFELLQNGGGTALMGYATPTTGPTRGVYGRSDSSGGDGVQARNAGAAGTGAAIRAFGGNNRAVVATTTIERGISIEATSSFGFNFGQGGSAIRGLAGSGTTAMIHPGWSDGFADAAGEFAGATGIIGATSHPGGGVGVVGLAPIGVGVQGETQSWYGVIGKAVDGIGVWGIADSGPAGVRGEAGVGHAVEGIASGPGAGVRGESGTGYAVDAAGRLKIDAYVDVLEMTAPAAPTSDRARLFVRDNAGKTQLCVLFNDGVVQVLAAQP